MEKLFARMGPDDGEDSEVYGAEAPVPAVTRNDRARAKKKRSWLDALTELLE